jgi:hypothetical protein
LAGPERTIDVLFVDLHSFTGIAEQKCPTIWVFSGRSRCISGSHDDRSGLA